MRNNLYGSSAKISMTLFLKYRPVYLTGCHVGIFIQTLIDKSLIMAKIQVCLCTVIGYKNFSMLDWIHCSRVNIDIGIKLLHGHLITPGL